MRRLSSAIVVGIVVGLVGYWAGAQLDATNTGDAAILVGYLSGATGFLVTLGFASEVVSRLRGRPGASNFKQVQSKGWTEYLGISLDYKVVAIQFAIGLALIAVVVVLVRVL
jgi:ammonia channel protein AmtB